jgi:2-phosphoglycerate kinase
MSKVILFRGKAGVGKSHLSSFVGQALNIAIIRKDDIYDSIAEYVEKHDDRNEICHETINRFLTTNISCGTDVIVDTSCHYINQVLDFKEWVLGQGAGVKSIVCICSDERLWANRFNKRKLDPKPNNLITDFEVLRGHYKNLNTDAIDGELILDTVEDINELIKKAIQYINS